GDRRRAPGDARLKPGMRRRIERRRSDVGCRDDLAIAMQLKRRGAAGGWIVAGRTRAADIVGMFFFALLKVVAGAANDLRRRRQPRNQQADNSNYYQQLNEREPTPRLRRHTCASKMGALRLADQPQSVKSKFARLLPRLTSNAIPDESGAKYFCGMIGSPGIISPHIPLPVSPPFGGPSGPRGGVARRCFPGSARSLVPYA